MTDPSTPSPFRSGPPAGASASPAPRPPPDSRTAQEHHKAGRLVEAEWAYRHWLSLHPADAAALHRLGLVNHQAGRQHEALGLLRATVRASGRVGQLREAAAELAEVVRIRPDYAEGHCNLAGAALPPRLPRGARQPRGRAVEDPH